MGLDRGLHDVKDELQMFIDSQKKKLDNDKKELRKAQASFSPRDGQQDENDYERRAPKIDNRFQGGKRNNNDGNFGGVPFGEHERKKQLIREERVKDYKKYAAQKEFRRTGDPSFLEKTPPQEKSKEKQEELFVKRQEVTTPDIIDAYAALLRKKRAEERQYRGRYDDPETEAGRKVHFSGESEDDDYRKRDKANIDDEELFQWAREKAKSSRKLESAGNVRTDVKDENPIDDFKRANSVPPNTVGGIFGGAESSNSAKTKKEQYKRELQMQMKEKEEQKLREKLKRMGRLPSADDTISATEKKKETSPRSTTRGVADDDHSPRSDLKQRTPRSRSRRRDQRPNQYDYDDVIDTRYESDTRMRGDHPSHRGMPNYDPYMQMMPNRFDMRMDPYMMQNAGYGGFPGFNGMMYGPNAGMMPRMDRFDDRRRDFGGVDGDMDREQYSRRDRRQTPHTPKSRLNDDYEQEKTRSKGLKSKIGISPRGKAAVAGVFGDSTDVDRDQERAAKRAYQDELKQQMQEKQTAKAKEKKEKERYEAKIDAEIAVYDPWGKAGGGAPLKDKTGHMIADLRTLHKFNEEGTIVSPRSDPTALLQSQGVSGLPQDSPVLAALGGDIGLQNIEKAAIQQSPRGVGGDQPYARGGALKELQGETKNLSQKTEQAEYQEYLKQQIEAKKRVKEEEERKLKEEEAKENRRLEAERVKMEKEFLLEQERERQKEQETLKKNDEMRKVAAEKRQEAERERQQMEEEKFRTIQRRSSEFGSPRVVPTARAASPPIPALQNKSQERPKSRPIPTLAKQENEIRVESHATQVSNPPSRHGHRNVVQESHAEESSDLDMLYLSSIRDELFQKSEELEASPRSQNNKASQDHVIRQLAALRKQLSKEEHKVQVELEKNVEKYKEAKAKPQNPKRSEANGMEIFEKARIRRGSATRRGAPKHADEFHKLADASSMTDFKTRHASKPTTSNELDLQQKEFIRIQEQKLQALRQAIKETSNHLMLSIKNEKGGTIGQRGQSKTSLLESESKFINMDDPVDGTNSRLSTAKSRRISPMLNDDDLHMDPYLQKPSTPGGVSVNSMTSQAIEEMAAKNEARLKKLQNSGRNVQTPDDPEGIVDDFLQNSAKQ